MNHETLDVCHICKKRKDFQMIDKPVSLFLTALDLKGENRRASVRKILLIQLMIGMFRQRRMIYFFHLRMIFQIFHHFSRVSA